MTLLLVGIGGALGAVARYSVSLIAIRYYPSFPFGTLIVNSLGSLVFGYYLGSELPDTMHYTFITAGFLGAFTTFSTFSMESIELLSRQNYLKAAAYILSHLFVPIGLAFIGFIIA